MRSTSTRRRLIAGGGVALALFGSLIIAERGSEAPKAPVSTKSIALSRPNISLPQINIPALPQQSSLLPQASQGPSTQNFSPQLFGELPGNTCEALLQVRDVLLELPDSPAVQAALALNALQLALFHCEDISGDF